MKNMNPILSAIIDTTETLARDLKILCEEKYELVKWQAFDQFSHTGHIETIVKLSLKKDTPKIEVTMEPDF